MTARVERLPMQNGSWRACWLTVLFQRRRSRRMQTAQATPGRPFGGRKTRSESKR